MIVTNMTFTIFASCLSTLQKKVCTRFLHIHFFSISVRRLINVFTYFSVEQKFIQPTNYSIQEAQEILAEIRNNRHSLHQGQKEKKTILQVRRHTEESLSRK